MREGGSRAFRFVQYFSVLLVILASSSQGYLKVSAVAEFGKTWASSKTCRKKATEKEWRVGECSVREGLSLAGIDE